jgi:hypothetical protein
VLLLVGIGALGFCLLAVIKWWRKDTAIQTTTDDASALARMDGDGR